MSPGINSKAKDVKVASKLSMNTMLTSKLSQIFKGVYVQNFFMTIYTYAQLTLRVLISVQSPQGF